MFGKPGQQTSSIGLVLMSRSSHCLQFTLYDRSYTGIIWK